MLPTLETIAEKVFDGAVLSIGVTLGTYLSQRGLIRNLERLEKILEARTKKIGDKTEDE